ncbi:MAG TPA: hypothetical protein VK698_35870 [Kofleriaceae bacterium]|nr:hypothetical protein [Kofleriaceae bacterium]
MIARRRIARHRIAGRWIALVVGVGAVAGHAAAFPWLIARLDRAPLRVRVRAPLAAPGPHLAISADLPGDAAARARVVVDGEELASAAALASLEPGPGLHRVEWRARYRGGIERRVGTTQLVGPFQDPASPPCSARLLVGQGLLDDGRAGPGTLAHLVAALVEREMDGFDAFPVGAFQRVRAVRIRWVGSRPKQPGHLRVALELGFHRAALELTIRLETHIVGGQLRLSSRAEARVKLDNRLVQWMSDLIDGDEIAARMARREIAAALDQVMTAPPPLPLGRGRALELAYCPGRDIEVVDGSHASVPLAVALAPAAAAARRAGRVGAPVLLPPAPALAGPPAAMTAPLAIELDGNALNGLLYVLWATGYLEESLAGSGIVERFNRDPIVAELLSVRARGPSLPLPPTLAPSTRPGQSYQIGVASALLLEDGALRTPAHLFGRAGFDLAASEPDRPAGLAPRLSLHELGLTCEPEPGLLEPCYPELAAQLIERAPEVHDQLSAWFSDLLARLLVDQEIAPAGSLARFRLRRSAIHPPPPGQHGPLRIDLLGVLESAP